MRQSKIEKGSQHGQWIVMSDPFLKKNIYYVNAKCSCGKLKEVKKNNILTGKSKSCGCIQQKNFKNLTKNKTAHNRVSNKHKLISELINQYKFHAEKRNLSFLLSRDQFESLIFKNCYYCNKANSNQKIIKDESIKYNGIDRVDNNIGYEIDNCVTCCRTCNIMKLNLDTQTFIEHINNIIKNNKINQKSFISLKKIDSYHGRAIAAASQSHDAQTKVGALLINNKTLSVMAEGYNGFVRGANDSIIPNTRPEKYQYMIHAEANLICNAVRSGVQTDEAILYCTLSPCVKCLRLLWQAGISCIYFKEKYTDFNESINMLDLKIEVDEYGEYYKMQVTSA